MGKVISSNHLLCDLRQRGGDMTQFSAQRERFSCGTFLPLWAERTHQHSYCCSTEM